MTDNKITKDAIEQAYCFLHQKWRIYQHSSMDWQKDDIEFAISQYAEQMNTALYDKISGGNACFLKSHQTFAKDMPLAVSKLDEMMNYM